MRTCAAGGYPGIDGTGLELFSTGYSESLDRHDYRAELPVPVRRDNHVDPEQMHHLKTLIMFISSGGTMSRNNARESLINHLQAPFQFIGMKDFRIIWADGQNKSTYPDYRDREEKATNESRLLAEEIADYTRDEG